MFNWDNPINRFLRTVYGYISVTILMMLCSLPLFTAGAALCAGYDTVRRYLVEEKGQNTLTVFFRSFKSNFKQATALWLICGVLFCFLRQSFSVTEMLQLDGVPAQCLRFTLLVGMALCIGVLLCALASTARFENTLFAILKTSFQLCIAHMGRFAVLLFTVLLSIWIVPLFPFLMLIVPSLTVFYWYRCMEAVFAAHLPAAHLGKGGKPSGEAACE